MAALLNRQKALNFQNILNWHWLIQSLQCSYIIRLNQRIMNSMEKVRSAFVKEGFAPTSTIRKQQLEQFLNSLLLREKGEPFDLEVLSEIWEQCSGGAIQTTVEQVCLTLVEAQNIVQTRLLQIAEELRYLREELSQEGNSPTKTRAHKIEQEISRLGEERVDYQSDLRFLTEPFGINPISFMSRATASRRNPQEGGRGDRNLDERGNEVQLKWLFLLTAGLGGMEVVMIYAKYDFLNLMVFACLLFIFLMNHFDRTYIRALLALLVISELLDAIWLFMNSSSYWSPPQVGITSGYEKGYLKLIVLLTYLAVFMKIPLGVFLYHYRNVEDTKTYDLDIGVVKFSLTPNKINPITQGINSILN